MAPTARCDWAPGFVHWITPARAGAPAPVSSTHVPPVRFPGGDPSRLRRVCVARRPAPQGAAGRDADPVDRRAVGQAGGVCLVTETAAGLGRLQGRTAAQWHLGCGNCVHTVLRRALHGPNLRVSGGGGVPAEAVLGPAGDPEAPNGQYAGAQA